MSVDFLFRLLFILYCLEAGIFLTWAPWTGFWDRTLVALPTLGAALLNPTLRGAVSGFGLVHLLWVVHDLEGLWTRREPAVAAPAAPPSKTEPLDASAESSVSPAGDQ